MTKRQAVISNISLLTQEIDALRADLSKTRVIPLWDKDRKERLLITLESTLRHLAYLMSAVQCCNKDNNLDGDCIEHVRTVQKRQGFKKCDF